MSDANRTWRRLLLSQILFYLAVCGNFRRIVILLQVLERIFILPETQLICHDVLFFLVSDVLLDRLLVPAYGAHLVPFAPEHPPSVLVLHVRVPLEDDLCTLPLEIPHEVRYRQLRWDRQQHVDMILHRVCFDDLHMLVVA